MWIPRASLVAQLVKNPPVMWETWVQSLGWEDPPGEGNGYPLQYPGLENSMDCIVRGVTESDTAERLSLSHFAVRCCPGCLNQDAKGLPLEEGRPAVTRRLLSAWSVGTLKPPVQRSTVVRGYAVSTPLYAFQIYLTLIIYLYS